jgi:hypothetical protein
MLPIAAADHYLPLLFQYLALVTFLLVNKISTQLISPRLHQYYVKRESYEVVAWG